MEEPMTFYHKIIIELGTHVRISRLHKKITDWVTSAEEPSFSTDFLIWVSAESLPWSIWVKKNLMELDQTENRGKEKNLEVPNFGFQSGMNINVEESEWVVDGRGREEWVNSVDKTEATVRKLGTRLVDFGYYLL